jgi:hypothetical protein
VTNRPLIRNTNCQASRLMGQKPMAIPHNEGLLLQEDPMAKGQQNNNKMVKKPKKDLAPPKPVSPDAVRPTVVTQVPLRGKLKNK